MTVEILDKETREVLALHIAKNGGEVKDPEFKELQKYLEKNPKDKILEYLDN